MYRVQYDNVDNLSSIDPDLINPLPCSFSFSFVLVHMYDATAREYYTFIHKKSFH